MHQVHAHINLNALKYNLNVVKKLSPKSRVIAVVKANAYGHGSSAVARALDECDAFAVARMDEALYLREQGIEKLIFLLEGVFEQNSYRLCEQYNLLPVIHCNEQFQWLQNYYNNTPDSGLCYWLKLDTGMHRLGLSEAEYQQLLSTIEQLPEHRRPSGVMSHFACADEPARPVNQQQLDCFNALLPERLKFQRSMANSAAIMSIADSHFDWVRPGIMLYGVSPFERKARDQIQLQPVMTLESELIAVKSLKKGDCIGYGSSWCCPQDMNIGVVGIGYGDGYPRHAQPGTPVLIHGLEVPLVGRVSMDMITIDLQALYMQSITPMLGDRVTLWGGGLPVERIAQCSETIAYELLCQITRRVTIKYE